VKLRFAVINISLAAVFLAALAGVGLRRPVATATGWRIVDPGTASAASADEISQLRRQLAEIREELPLASARALASIRVPDEATLCGQRIDLSRPELREALVYELVLAVGRPLMPMLWSRRAPEVLPLIEASLEEAGLPDDLKYVAMVESDLRLNVRSPAGAEGLWQFMRDTARRYGLRVDRYLDERRDPERSTEAAIAHLTDLHEEFGDWFLAMAAYNAGERRVSEALAEQGDIGYFDMYLPYETRRYVYRVLAAKLVYEDPGAYGLSPMVPLHVPSYAIVEVQVRGARADLRELAKEHGFGYAALRLANPKLGGAWLPRGTHRLRVPQPAAGD
jgi:hypothetical protein